MSTFVDTLKSVIYKDGHIVIIMRSGVEIRFPIAGNPRLAHGTPQQLIVSRYRLLVFTGPI